MENHSPPPPLSEADKREVFRLATRSFTEQFARKTKNGMTDTELEQALKDHLGIFGGSGGPDRLSVTHQGAGLKIWGGWHTVNHVKEKPLYSGRHAVAFVREVYGISDPSEKQGNLF